MNTGFTGTRLGMTPAQRDTFARLVGELPITLFRHGDCIGADAVAHDICSTLIPIIIHPPVDNTLRANKVASCIMAPKTHFARNRDIVDQSEILIAVPQYADPITPTTRGGTAYTVNYARKVGKPVKIIRPDGSIESEGAKTP